MAILNNIISTFSQKHLALLLIILCLLISSAEYGQQTTDKINYLSPHNRLIFGNYLYADKDYLRAADEFKEYLKVESSDTVQFRFANSFFKIGRYTDAIDNFKNLFFSSSISNESRLMYYESNFFLKDYKTFRDLAERDDYLPIKFQKEIERLKFITYFFDDAFLPDQNLFLRSFPDSMQQQISKFYQLKKYPKHRSVTTAVILSTLIPGAGKIYTGEIGDGITALISTALCGYLAVTNFKADHQFRGWLFTGLAAFFYTGNIYGSAASAQIYNARVRFNFVNEVKIFFDQRNYLLPQIDF